MTVAALAEHKLDAIVSDGAVFGRCAGPGAANPVPAFGDSPDGGGHSSVRMGVGPPVLSVVAVILEHMIEEGGVQGLAAVPPGPALAACLAGLDPVVVPNDDIVEVLVARSRQLAHEQAQVWRVMAEVLHRRPFAGPGQVRRSDRPDLYGADEVRAALSWTRRAAEAETDLALVLVDQLPLVFAAVLEGSIDRGRAVVFARHLVELTAEQITVICEVLVPVAAGLTTGQLQERIKRMIVEIDPDFYDSRYRKALVERRLVHYLDAEGAAVVTATGLPAGEAAAAMRRVDDLARTARRAGHPGTLDQIRADVFLMLLDGSVHGMTRDGIIDALFGRYAGPAGGGAEGGPGPDDPGAGGGGSGGPGPDGPVPDPEGGGARGGEPERGEPERGEPERGEPGCGEPGCGERGSGDPASSGPEGGGPGYSAPECSDPDSGDPDSGDPDSGDPDSGDPDSGDPDSGGHAGTAGAGDRSGTDVLAVRGCGVPGGDEPGTDETDTNGADPRGAGPDGADAGEAGAAAAETGGVGAHGPVTSGAGGAAAEDQRVGIEIRVPLLTLLGVAERAGELPGLGPVTPATARAAVARARHAQWRWVVVDPDGRLRSEGLTRRRPQDLDRHGPRGGIVELQITDDDLTRLATNPDRCGPWAGVIADIARQHTRHHNPGRLTDLDAHPEDRFPRAGLRRHVQIRDRTCCHPGCRAPATTTDIDHTVDHARGGPTVRDDLGPACRHDHTLKTSGGWSCQQPEPGRFVWTSPLGRRYTVQPEPILPPPVTATPRTPDPWHDQPAQDLDQPLVAEPGPPRAPPTGPTQDHRVPNPFTPDPFATDPGTIDTGAIDTGAPVGDTEPPPF